MENEGLNMENYETQPNNGKQPSYWNSVIIASAITAVIVVAISLLGGYMTLGSEPTGSFFNKMQLLATLACLIGAVGGVIANWHYVKEYEITYKIGTGALIGLWVGLVATILTVILGQIWNLIDPSYQQALIDWNIQNFEAMQIPEDAKQQAIESMDDPNSPGNIAMQALFTFIGLGVLNVFSGLIGAKIFASEE